MSVVTQADLSNCDMTDTMLDYVVLRGANLRGSIAVNANFIRSDMGEIDATDVDFTDAIIDKVRTPVCSAPPWGEAQGQIWRGGCILDASVRVSRAPALDTRLGGTAPTSPALALCRGALACERRQSCRPTLHLTNAWDSSFASAPKGEPLARETALKPDETLLSRAPRFFA